MRRDRNKKELHPERAPLPSRRHTEDLEEDWEWDLPGEFPAAFDGSV